MDRKRNIEDELILNLRNLGRVMRSLYEGRESQKRILIILREAGGMTQAQLTQRLGIQQGSASEVIRKLDSAGMICRIKNSADKRTVDISLTELGQKTADIAVSQRKQRHKEMFSCLTEQEKEELRRITEKINSDWKQRYSNRNQEEKGQCGNM